jgi:hypothetical protein
MSSEVLRRVVSQELTDVSEVSTTSVIGAMKETVSTSETSVTFYQTALRNIPKYSYLHTRRHEQIKFHKVLITFLNTQQDWLTQGLTQAV